MATVRVCVLRAAGTNCDLEAVHAWELAGAQAERVHVRRLLESPNLLGNYQILTLPGGFSYGDDVAAGRILAAQLKRHLSVPLHDFIDRGNLILGICNGFQVLVQTDLLPHSQSRADGRRHCTITYNDPPGFQDRWVCLQANGDRCVFLEPGRRYEMPIAHGEGRVLFDSVAEYARVAAAGQDVLLYCQPPTSLPPGAGGGHADASQAEGDLPANPNGSQGDIGGLCDETGRVLGLMPHPERFVAWSQHPCWTSLPPRTEGDGLAIFRRATGYFGQRAGRRVVHSAAVPASRATA